MLDFCQLKEIFLRFRLAKDECVACCAESVGRIVIHTHGRPRERAYAQLVDIYISRLKGRGCKLHQHSEKLSHDEYGTKLEEITGSGNLILLDENGTSGTTDWFVKRWKRWKISDSNTHLAIGPVDGFTKEFVSRHDSIGLGPMTMTYEMAAVVLLEQLYRASEIERGSPYHRE